MKIPIQSVKVILADDHEVLREGIRSIVQKQPHIEIVAEASNGLELVQLTDQLIPDVIITDIKMPLMDGLEATRIISKKHPLIGIIALSMFDDDKMILDMLEAGARGYLLKNAGKDEIVDAINTLVNMKSYFCKNISIKMVKIMAATRFGNSKAENKTQLSQKEKQVVILICRQFFTKEISDVLNLSPRTIDGYRENILRKINARNAIGIVLYAIAHHLYDPSDPDNKTR